MMAERWSGYKLSRGPSREVEGSNLDEDHDHFYKHDFEMFYATDLLLSYLISTTWSNL